ncbi:hypothetical protein key_091 [Erwinia phage KEY]|uniref:C2H2-type domain-containing protein n=1 Tax=Erwinia phage KEY TaxID=2821255 RepID=A0AAE8BDQ3_9CAUD|nr:hypothetical protein key_091 [Erwinia phage KEY]
MEDKEFECQQCGEICDCWWECSNCGHDDLHQVDSE